MPSTIYLVTGGARSGKSGYAQRLCESLSDSPIYLATSKVWDADFKQRIQRHQSDRGDKWTTIEEPLYPSQHVKDFSGKVILVDCLTLWLTNFMVEQGALNMPESEGQNATSNDDEKDAPARALEACKEEFIKLTEPWDITFVFVTNEIGSGTHSDNSTTRSFVDQQGWLNQFVAEKAERVISMVCGQPSMIKEPSNNDRRHPLAIPNKQNAIAEAAMLDKFLSARKLPMDAKGYFMISVDHSVPAIVVKFYSCILNDKGEVCDLEGNKIPCHGNNRAGAMETWKGRSAKELTVAIFEKWQHASIVSVGHAAYVGREVQRAEQCLYSETFYQQD